MSEVKLQVDDTQGAERPVAGPSLALERALLLTLVCHAAAMLGMVLLLLPVLPGGGTSDDHARIVRIAEHPWLFRLGWFPWQLTALSDLFLAVVLVRTRWIPRGPALAGLLLTLAALLPDQGGQALWISRGVELAQEALRSGTDAAYLAFEASVFVATAAWGALFYTLGAIAWSFCFAGAGAWTRTLTRLSAPLWGLFMIISVAPLLPVAVRPAAGLVAAGNAVGFVLLQLWFALVLQQVRRLARPPKQKGASRFSQHG